MDYREKCVEMVGSMDRLLNVGCGEFYADGWVNIDIYDGNKVDLVASVLELPFSDDSFDRIYCGHILEHLTISNVYDAITEIRRVLKPAGRVLAVGPDIDRAAKLREAGQLSKKEHLGILFGDQRWAGDEHLWHCYEERLRLLLDSRFSFTVPVPIEQIGESWPLASKAGWQCAILAW